MLDWFATAVASASAAKDISQSLITLRDEEMIRSRVFDLNNNLMDLQQQLMQAQVEQMQLISKVADLERQNESLRKQTDLESRYVLHQFSTGAFAYKLKPENSDGQPEHFLCSKCFERGTRTTMHSSKDQYQSILYCPECKRGIDFEPARPVPQPRSNYWLDQ